MPALPPTTTMFLPSHLAPIARFPSRITCFRRAEHLAVWPRMQSVIAARVCRKSSLTGRRVSCLHPAAPITRVRTYRSRTRASLSHARSCGPLRDDDRGQSFWANERRGVRRCRSRLSCGRWSPATFPGREPPLACCRRCLAGYGQLRRARGLLFGSASAAWWSGTPVATCRRR
jgi:hypothetical protein